jgi:hypothetical protein
VELLTAALAFQLQGEPVTTRVLQPPYISPMTPTPCRWFEVDWLHPDTDVPAVEGVVDLADGRDVEITEHPPKPDWSQLPSPDPTLGETRPPHWGVPTHLMSASVQTCVLSPDDQRVAYKLRDGSVWVSAGVGPPSDEVLQHAEAGNLAWSPDNATLAVGPVLVNVSQARSTRIPVALDDTLVHWMSGAEAVLVDRQGTVWWHDGKVDRLSPGFIPRPSPDGRTVAVAVGPNYDQFLHAETGPLSQAHIELVDMRTQGHRTLAPGYQAEWVDGTHVAVMSLSPYGDTFTPRLTVQTVAP